MKKEEPMSVQAFTRARITWLAYLLLAFYAYLLNVLGPIMPFLRADLHVSYTESSLHSTVFAVGIIIAGLLGDRVVHRYGWERTLWCATGGMVLGALLLLLSRTLFMSLMAVALMGTLGSFLLLLVPAILSHQHGPKSAIALTEANVLGSSAASIAPIGIAVFVQVAGSWRVGLLAMLALFILLVLVFRTPVLSPARESSVGRDGESVLPLAFWLYWGVLVLSVALEFSMIFWTADFLEHVTGLPRTEAVTFVSLFTGSMLLGRVVGSRLVRRWLPRSLVLLSLLLAVCGFLLYWSSRWEPSVLVGLVLTGLGVANLYPLVLSLALQVARGSEASASARASLASGAALLCAPLLLGWLADQVGLRSATSVIFVFLALAVGGMLLVSWLSRDTFRRKRKADVSAL